MNTELLAALPGYLAPSRGRAAVAPVLTVDELDRAIGEFVIGDYNGRKHPELDAAPRDVWTGDGWLPRLPETLQQLDGLLLTVASPRKVARDGIHFQGLRYTWPTLAAYVGARVVIRYDPRDISEIRVFHNNDFLCKAVDPTNASAAISLKQVQAARNARPRQMRTQLHERIAVVAAHLPDRVTRRPPAGASEPNVRAVTRLKTYREEP